MGIEEIILEDLREEAYQKGYKEGFEKSIKYGDEEWISMVIKNVRSIGCTLEFIAEIVELPVKDVRRLLDSMGVE